MEENSAQIMESVYQTVKEIERKDVSYGKWSKTEED